MVIKFLKVNCFFNCFFYFIFLWEWLLLDNAFVRSKKTTYKIKSAVEFFYRGFKEKGTKPSPQVVLSTKFSVKFSFNLKVLTHLFFVNYKITTSYTRNLLGWNYIIYYMWNLNLKPELNVLQRAVRFQSIKNERLSNFGKCSLASFISTLTYSPIQKYKYLKNYTNFHRISFYKVTLHCRKHLSKFLLIVSYQNFKTTKQRHQVCL